MFLLLYISLDDICSTYTQILASSKTYVGIIIMYRLLQLYKPSGVGSDSGTQKHTAG